MLSSVLSTEFGHLRSFEAWENILLSKYFGFVIVKLEPSPKNVKQYLSNKAESHFFLFFLLKVEVYRVFMSENENKLIMGSWVDFELKMTLKNHF